jgi:hypothetical protein
VKTSSAEPDPGSKGLASFATLCLQRVKKEIRRRAIGLARALISIRQRKEPAMLVLFDLSDKKKKILLLVLLTFAALC